MSDHWQPMSTAPRDGAILDVRHVSKAHGEIIFRTRWLAPVREWVDWDRQHVSLSKAPLRGWRYSDQQFRAWTPQEEATLAELHGEECTTYLDAAAWNMGIRRPVTR
jgi:hypothetical protein